ncbi:MAG: lipid-A-disaccharide synthase N-terminal domain-containing protein [Bacteroidota bacterium]|uniref:lipid-A-disaccharide synthase N-terminal domain-containing protein n=1 Tax=Leeuwenhoekiella palythoae TaxID=573501 RepID=UPI000C4DA45B|nr:lipid-A-disaccharide synthase N-terminal domain-containing protein [Leeuwenhoekiella palythoae]MAS20814.1 lauroyl acyltransferase [Leeuwenhoekiella sp.]MEC7782977.1 lipid-A-disaccharide synthase N-terminal domain-containing protein [Bacteroidota bacterium]MEC8683932.1 lipid-A-disaccharide synthase N-terminal domain-containing protein [Bacteroidota bacterium]MEE3225551.1 lipid-A-disaccharide synthase N-terminal domain-containing protein [Bacteroidota bacterium]UBZ09197.1 lipid-A-disaccharide|tara:strand:- start:199 stop:828 length:630 start_codon:yes stop_codon:yes gene_type:complete
MDSPFWIYSVGFLAQLMFSGRLVIQWFLSEKQKRVLTPSTFWWLSLGASFLLFVYGYLREDFAIMLGQSLTYFLYIRNLQLQGQWVKTPKILRWFLLIFPVLLVIYGYNNGDYDVEKLFKNEDIPLWLLILGSIAQVIFTLRFIYQWIYSERKKKSSLPLGFWLLSLIGGLLILTYAILRKDPVLFVGHLMGVFIYFRNMRLSIGIDKE